MWDETPLDLEGLKSWLQARLGQSIERLCRVGGRRLASRGVAD